MLNQHFAVHLEVRHMEKRLPPELEALALSTLLSYVISVLDEDQKERLNELVKARPIEVPGRDTSPEQMEYMNNMREYMRDAVRLGLGFAD